MANRDAHVVLAGGEDLVSSGLEIAPGRAQLLWNYVVSASGGYAKVKGYHKYHGGPITLTYNTGNGTQPTVGSAVTIGGIIATILTVVVSTGTWAAGTATGTITVNEVYGGASSPSAGAAVFEAATATVSSVFAPLAVPGSGSIKGLHIWDNTLYAVRSDGEATPHDVLYKATALGWTEATLGSEIAFTVGNGTTPLRGNQLTQGGLWGDAWGDAWAPYAWGVTSPIAGVVITSGTFTGGDAVGYFYIPKDDTKTFTAGAAILTGSTVTLGGAQSDVTMHDGEQYEFINENFTGVESQSLMYGCCGAGPAFEYDGDALVFINSGASTEAPTHLVSRGERLWLSQPGGNIFFSSPGAPTTGFTQDYTAGAVTVGDECTGLRALQGGTLAIFGERVLKLLTGNISGGAGDMALVEHGQQIGAKEGTIAQMSDCYFVSEIGATSLYQTDKYGNFAGAGLSQAIEPFIKQALPTFFASVAIKRSGFWRLFYQESESSNTQWLNCTFSSGRMVGWSRGDLGFRLTAVTSGIIDDTEVVFAGDDEGNVYQLESGRNMDGSDMLIGTILPYNHFQMPTYDKQWRKTILQLDALESFDLSYAVEFNYSAKGWASETGRTFEAQSGGVLWSRGTWNTFSWSGSSIYGTADLYTFGVGHNMAIILTATGDNIPDHTLRAYSAIFEPRREVH